jgi:hypothetical protein
MQAALGFLFLVPYAVPHINSVNLARQFATEAGVSEWE